nr:hypothetical protein [Streptomyces griseochromogenes]
MEGLHEDGYFPDHVVDGGWTILLALCPDVEELIATREW